MNVRPASVEDARAVRALLIELGRPDDDAPTNAGRFAAYLARDDTAAFVAVDGERIIGFIDLEFRPRLNFETPQAWVPDLIVAADARGRGAGRALLLRAVEESRARGAWGITLESAEWRERAHAFYRREGMTDAGRSFSMSLDGSRWPPPSPSGG